MKKLNSQLANWPDRENAVYDIYENTEQVAEISNEPGEGLKIDIFPSPDGSWHFCFNEFLSLLEEVGKNLEKP